MMNQAVHLMNTALQMGSRVEDHADPRAVQAELYQAHPNIEVEDLAALRADLGEATLHFYCTTNCDDRYRTDLDIFGTKGRAEWDTDKAVVHLDGEEEPIVFEEPTDRDEIHKNLIAAIRGETRRCTRPAEEAVKATLLIDGAYASAGRIQQVPWTDMTGHQLADGLLRGPAQALQRDCSAGPTPPTRLRSPRDFRFDGLWTTTEPHSEGGCDDGGLSGRRIRKTVAAVQLGAVPQRCGGCGLPLHGLHAPPGP
jgi:hypothetical protein